MSKSHLADIISHEEGMPPDKKIGIFEKFTHPEGWLRDRIIIRQQEGPGGKEPVSLSVNGFRIDIPREVECDIARPFTNVLKNAVETQMYYGKDGESLTRKVPRFNWVMIKEGVNFQALKNKLKSDLRADQAEGSEAQA